jgi:TolA-binding protein
MDCEGFDDVALDLVDGDGRRDARALEDAKRHVEGCTRCAASLRALRSAREAVTLPALAVPDGLEARILTAARRRERETRSGWWQRLDLFISRAGAYAMRPQPAMALVLLLMVGSSLFLLRAKPGSSARVVVTERGVPIPQAAEKVDEPPPVAAAPPATATAPAPVVAAAPAASAAPSPSPLALRDEERAVAKMEGARGGLDLQPKDSAAADEPSVRSREASREPTPETVRQSEGPVAMGRAAAASPPPPAPLPAAAAPRADTATAAPGGAAASGADATFSAAMENYKARRFAEAQRGFDLIVSEGGAQAPLAALYAARSVRYNGGCSPAVTRFDSVANRFAGTSIAAEAMWEGALCFRELGQNDRSRQLFLALRRVAGYRERVDRELAELDQRPAGGGVVGGARPAAPARAPAAAPRARPPVVDEAAPAKR